MAYVIGGIREKGREWAFKCNLSPARLDLRWLRGESIPSKVPKHCPLITKSIAAAFKDLVTFRTRLAKGEEFINCEKK